MNLLVHMDARGTSSVYPHLGIRATYFTRWPGLRGATHLDDCLGPGHCFGLGYVARLCTAPPVIRVRPRARLGVASAGSATRNRSRSSANKTSCTVAYDMVLTSCGHRLVDFLRPPPSVRPRVVRMTGLIAATSPLPESTAFHNRVIQATRGCAARPCERSAELASARPSSMHGEFLRVPRLPAIIIWA